MSFNGISSSPAAPNSITTKKDKLDVTGDSRTKLFSPLVVYEVCYAKPHRSPDASSAYKYP
jgi:hypothetical protein